MINKKFYASLFACFCFISNSAKAQMYSPSHLIYFYASSSNIVGAKRISDKYGIDTMDVRGDTPLCHSMRQKDAKTYKILLSMGAKSNEYCLEKNPKFKKILAEYDATTTGAYHNTGSLLSRPKTITPDTGLTSLQKTGLVAGGIAIVGGIAAASGGGGGGGSSSDEKNFCEKNGGTMVDGECILPEGRGAAPRSDNPEDFHTQEYERSVYLATVNADKAYARGYTGYIVNRNEDGTLVTDGSELISENKVIVGVFDNGFDINHPDLIDNIAKDEVGNPYGYNFDYGPCRKGDTRNCYALVDGKFSLYGDVEGEIIAQSSPGLINSEVFDALFKDYPADYDWNKLQYDPAMHNTSTEENKVDPGTNFSSSDHGTHVMGIIGAVANDKGIQGVAPNVELIGVSHQSPKISFIAYDNMYENAIDAFVAEEARVVNMSFGIKTTDEKTQASYAIGKSAYGLNYDASNPDQDFDSMLPFFEGLADNNIVLVKAAGNEGNHYEADILSGIPLTDTFKPGSEHDLTNLFITVVSTNSNNELAYYSQKCGATQNYCLAAPGGDASNGEFIYSTVQGGGDHYETADGSYGFAQGTSMAAPVVTGSVALLMGAYPHLTSQQIVQILFETATDLGEEGVDEVFGHGLINLDAATSPVGYLEFDFLYNGEEENPEAEPETFSASALRLSKSATVKILEKLPAKFTVYDKYDRGFEISSSALFADTSKQQRHLFENEFKAFMSKGKQTVKTSNKLSFTFNSSVAKNDLHSIFGYLNMDYKMDNKASINAFYSENTILNSGEIFTRTAQNPFISMDNAFGLGFNYNLNSKATVKVDYTMGKNNFYEDMDNSDLYDNRMEAVNSELSYSLGKNIKFASNIGMLQEDGSVLGMIGTNTFEFDGAQTYFGGVQVSYMPTDKLSLTASYTKGYTDTSVNNRLFSMSDIESESISFNATYNLSKDANVGIDVYSPLRIVKGTTDITLSTGRHPTEDKVYMQTYQTSLKDETREWDFSMFYNKKLKEDANFKTRFGIRLNPEHEKNAKPDYFGMFNLNFAF